MVICFFFKSSLKIVTLMNVSVRSFFKFNFFNFYTLLVDLLMTISNGKLPAIWRIQPSLYRMVVDVVCSYIKWYYIVTEEKFKSITTKNVFAGEIVCWKTNIYLSYILYAWTWRKNVAQTLQIFLFFFYFLWKLYRPLWFIIFLVHKNLLQFILFPPNVYLLLLPR